MPAVPTPSLTMLIALVMVTVPYPAGSSTSIWPPAAVWVSAKAKVRQGAVTGQPPASVPLPENQGRFGPACAGAAERPRARRAPAMVGNDVILIMACPPRNAE